MPSRPRCAESTARFAFRLTVRFAVRGVTRAALRVVVLLAALILPAAANADTCRWTGAAIDNLWSRPANWAACHSGGVPLNGDIVSFPDNAVRPSSQNDLVGLTLNTLLFTGEGAGDVGFALSGQAITISSVITFNSTIAGASVSAPITVNGPAVIRNIGTALALLTGAIACNANLSLQATAGDLFIGQTISGTCTLSKNGANRLVLARANSYSGTTQVFAGELILQNAGALGSAAPGTNGTTINGGATLSLETSGLINEPVTFEAGSRIEVHQSNGGIAGPVTLNGALTAATTAPTWRLTLAGTVSGTGTIVKIGSGSLVLGGTATHAGSDVQAGLLLVNGPAGGAPVSLTGGLLGGTGQTGNVTGTTGTIAPGLSPGLLTIGSLALGAGVTLTPELNGAAIGSGHDQLSVLGTVSLGDAVLSPTVGFTPPPDTPFVIVSNNGTDAVTGRFAGLPEGATLTAGSTRLRISYRGGDGNDIVLTALPPVFTRYFAEGASNSFYATRIAVLNPNLETATVTLRLLGGNGAETSLSRTVGSRQRTTFELTPDAGLPDTVFSTVVESDYPVVADRLMTWDGTGYGSTLETAIAAPGTTWYLAEGATGSYSLYYLLQNPGNSPAQVTVSYLLPAPHAPIVETYTVDPRSRFTIDVAGEHPDLAAAEVSAKITSTQPIVVERAMYVSLPGQFQAAGHDGAAQPAAATRWFLAEGATGFFDEYVLIANAEPAPAAITATFLLEEGASFSDTFSVPANSRYTLDLKRYPQLQATPVSVIIQSSSTPVVVERVMWWPSGQPWYEASLSAGVTQAGDRWAIAEGEVGGPFNSSTYVLIANTNPTSAAVATVTLLYEDSTSDVTTITLAPNSRETVDASTLPHSANKRFGVIVEGGPSLVVERSMFGTIPGRGTWTAGATSVATNLSPTP